MTVHELVPTGAVGAAVAAAITGLGIHSDRASRVRVVVEELITEARGRERFKSGSGNIEVVVSQRVDAVRIKVTDNRMPISPKHTARLPSRRLAALGFVDSLHITNNGKRGNVAVCQIAEDDPQTAADITEPIPAGTTERPVDSDDAAHVEIRPMTPHDVHSLIRCVYRCYGYSYPEDDMYQPAALRKQLRSGQMGSVVAIATDGELVGHAAMLFSGPEVRVPEAARLLVDPRYRGHHLAQRLRAARADMARTVPVPGLWTECVTNHPASQLNFIAGGGVEMGLLIGADVPGVVMADLADASRGRRAMLAMYSPFERKPEIAVNVPQRLAARIEELAHRCRLKRTIHSPAARARGRTDLGLHIDVGAEVAYLRAHTLGADLLERVAAELEQLIAHDIAAVHIDVPLTSKSAPWAIDSLESLGFFWASWIPQAREDGDVLRLQRVGERVVDVSHIVCARPEGDDLRDWVITEWERVRFGPVTPERVQQ